MLAAAEAALADLTLACLVRGLEEEIRPEARRAKYIAACHFRKEKSIALLIARQMAITQA